MARYKFNNEQLRFVEERRGFFAKFRRLMKYFLASILLSVLYYFIMSLFFSTEYEKQLELQTQLMEQESNRIESKLEILDGTVKNLEYRDREIYRSIFNAEPPSVFEVEYNDYSEFERVDTTNLSSLSKQYAVKVNELEDRVENVQGLMNSIIESVANNEGLKNIPSILPLPIKDFTLRQTGASIGSKINPFFKSLLEHTGLDLVAPTGTSVLASADGKVSLVVKKTKYGRSEGNMVEIDHGNGYVTKYMMLGNIKVRKNQKVKRGDVIGVVGVSGMSFAPHLHYEVWYKNRYMEPINYFFADLSPALYAEMMLRAANTGQSLD